MYAIHPIWDFSPFATLVLYVSTYFQNPTGFKEEKKNQHVKSMAKLLRTSMGSRSDLTFAALTNRHLKYTYIESIINNYVYIIINYYNYIYI